MLFRGAYICAREQEECAVHAEVDRHSRRIRKQLGGILGLRWLNLRARQALRSEGLVSKGLKPLRVKAPRSPHTSGKRLEMKGSQMLLQPPVGRCEQN